MDDDDHLNHDSQSFFSDEDETSSLPDIDIELTTTTNNTGKDEHIQRCFFQSFHQAALNACSNAQLPSLFEEGNKNRANAYLFHDCCSIFQLISHQKGRNLKLSMLSSFFHPRFDPPHNPHPILRLFVSSLDEERPRYFLKSSSLSRLYTKVLGLAPTGQLAIRLNDSCNPALNDVTGIPNGSFPTVLMAVLTKLGNAGASPSRLTCQTLNSLLDSLHNATSPEDRLAVLKELICVHGLQSPLEHYWLCRIILKMGFVGLESHHVLYSVDKKLPRWMSFLGHLRRAVAYCSFPQTEEVTFHLFFPVRPMLSSRTRISLATCALDDFIIEEKLDGDRLLVHIHQSEGKFRLFTRNQKDFTRVYGTPAFVSDLFHATRSMSSVILDGELIPVNEKDVLRTGRCMNMEIACQVFEQGEASPRWLVLVVFDVLFVNGMDITNWPLWRRKKALDMVLPNKHVHVLQPMSVVLGVSDLEARHKRVMEQLDLAIAEHREGLVLKSLNSPYSVHERSKHWVKVKPDYVGELGEGLDCICLGGSTDEHSQHPLHVSSLLLGLAESKGTYRPFCMTRIGLTDLDWKMIHRRFQDFGVLSKAQSPSHFKLPISSKVSVWIPPQHSFLVEVSGTQMLAHFFRFPYIRAIRFDLDISDCITLDEKRRRFAQGYRQDCATSVKRLDVHGKPPSPVPSGRQRLPAPSKTPFVTEPSTLMRHDSVIFANKVFLVFEGQYRHEKYTCREDVEGLIRAHGGKVNNWKSFKADIYIAADISSQRIANQIRCNPHMPHILTLDFICDCIRLGQCLTRPNRFTHFLVVNKNDILLDLSEKDEFNDSYTTNADLESLAKSLHLVRNLSLSKQLKFDCELEKDATPGIFGGWVAWFDLSHEKELCQLQFRLLGGSLDGEVTHKIVEDDQFLVETSKSNVAVLTRSLFHEKVKAHLFES